MDNSDFQGLACLAPLADRSSLIPPSHSTDETDLPCSYALHTPPLRYDVASLEHWLDLNA